jgi:hypothetical protein
VGGGGQLSVRWCRWGESLVEFRKVLEH